jgi:uncharacterized protein (TIGR02246 family)
VDLRAYVDEWIDAWNSRDVERVLAHFADDVVFSSPLAAAVVEGSGGVVRGKDALRAYWRAALERSPEIRFELVGAYVGVSATVINYRNHRGQVVSEVLIFDGDLVVAGYVTYLEV